MSIVCEKNYFKKFLHLELQKSKPLLSQEIRNYLVDLLHFYLFTHRLFDCKDESGNFHDQIFVHLCKKIQETDSKNELIYLYKKMGDLSLYLSGFFRHFVQKKGMHLTYYEGMGQNAYSFLANKYERFEKNNIFKFLCEDFSCLAEALYLLQENSKYKSETKYLHILS